MIVPIPSEDSIEASTSRLVDRLLSKFAGWDESKHPRQPGGSTKGGEFAPIHESIPQGNRVAIKEAHGSYPKHLTAGLKIIRPSRMSRADRSFYDNGEIHLSKNDLKSDVQYTTSDMTGNRLADSRYKGAAATGAKVVKNLPAYLLSQIVAHEMGHHVMNGLDEPTKMRLAKILNKTALKVHTRTVASYADYFRGRVDETGEYFQGFANRRVAHEAFAEAARLKATDTKEYKKRVPAALRGFIDEIWKAPKK